MTDSRNGVPKRKKDQVLLVQPVLQACDLFVRHRVRYRPRNRPRDLLEQGDLFTGERQQHQAREGHRSDKPIPEHLQQQAILVFCGCPHAGVYFRQ
jgi:hypothetical protein